jgi:transcriptional regulator with GAF, ATPase, and Fis domain
MRGDERRTALGAIIGDDPALRAALARAALVAPTTTPVLVTGESGTGKELLARALHELGPNPEGPFVAVNCGALPRELAESELFGHERGAFTGAAARRAGWFEEAAGGTLVLDEIGELPLDLQPKLLRVLESGRLRRVGGSGEIAARTRVVAMTLRDLEGEIQRRAFRADLYYRLAGLCVRLPPLRERRGDIPLLARHFLR